MPALFGEFSARHVPGLSAFEVKPWDMLEVAILGPHGNLPRLAGG